MAQQGTKSAEVVKKPTDNHETMSLREQIESLAYSLWQERGRPEGTPEEDWFRAEEELKANR
jgi:hypothetical protein